MNGRENYSGGHHIYVGSNNCRIAWSIKPRIQMV